MKLFYSPGACSLADHIALVEGGLDYSLERVDLKTKRTEGGGDYLTVNPKGYVPALRLDDGETLTENLAVLGYIAQASGRLQPADGLAHWRVVEATAFISTEIHKSFKPLILKDTEDRQKQAIDMLVKRFGTIADMLGEREFLVGDSLSVADCYLFVMLRWADQHAVPLPDSLVRHRERLAARPGFARALAEEGLN